MEKKDFGTKYLLFIDRTKYFIIALWVLLLFASIPGVLTVFSHLQMEYNAPDGTKAAEARDLFMSEFDEDSYEDVIVIIRSSDGSSVLTSYVQDFTIDLVQGVTASKVLKDHVDIGSFLGYFLLNGTDIERIDPSAKYRFLSEDNDSTFITFELNVTAPSGRAVDELRSILDRITPEGYRSYLFSNSAIHKDTTEVVISDIGRIDIVAVPLVFIVLFILFRNIKLVPLPLISIGIVLVFSLALLSMIARFTAVITFVPTIMSAVGLGVGVDYALFMLSRFQEERNKGASVQDATGTMLRKAGMTILVSGLTLGTAFLGLIFFPMSLISSLGLAISLIVALTLLNNLLLLPAVTLSIGGWLCKGRKVEVEGPLKESPRSNWRKVGAFSSKYALAVIALTLVLSTPITLQLIDVDVTDNSEDLFPSSTESYSAYKVLGSEFQRTMTRPIDIVVRTQGPGGVWTQDLYNHTVDFLTLMEDDDEVNSASIMSIAYMNGNRVPYDVIMLARMFDNLNDTTRGHTLSLMTPLEQDMFHAYRATFFDYVDKDQECLRITLLLNVSPLSDAAKDWLDMARTDYVEQCYEGMYQVGFHCRTAESMDIVESAYSTFPWMVVAVVLVIYLIIALMYRSALIPLRLLITVGLTIAFIFGAASIFLVNHLGGYLFDDINSVSGIFWVLPIFSFCFIIGLGMDYDLFIVSRIRESVWAGKNTKEAIEDSLESTGRLVTGAGAIMVVSFGGMMLSTMLPLIEMGFIMGFAIFLDATVVRILLVPAIMSIADKWNWWPAKPPKG